MSMNSEEKLAMENLAYLDDADAGEGASGKETVSVGSSPMKMSTVDVGDYDPKEELKAARKEAAVYKNVTCCLALLLGLFVVIIIMLFVGLIPSIRDNFIGALMEVTVQSSSGAATNTTTA